MKTHEIKSLTGRACSRRSWCTMLVASAVALACVTLCGSRAWAANGTAYSGEASVVQIQVPLLGVDKTIVHAGPLPAKGGAAHDHLLALSYGVGPVAVNAEVLHAAAVAQGKTSRAEASVANVDLVIAGHTISADFLMARATAQCTSGTASVSGSSQVAELVLDGQEIVGLEFPPNTTINLVDAAQVVTVIINEQSSTVTPDQGEITVNALHVTVLNPLDHTVVADVVISSAHADIDCAGRNPVGDFVTGGGWITGTPSGLPANFGVAGGIKNTGLWGHLTYIDHGARLHVKGTGVTAYSVTGPTSRHIEGTCEIDGAAGTYQVDVSDNGEPGRDDTFTISLSSGYYASGTLVGGNIQLHVKP